MLFLQLLIIILCLSVDEDNWKTYIPTNKQEFNQHKFTLVNATCHKYQLPSLQTVAPVTFRAIIWIKEQIWESV